MKPFGQQNKEKKASSNAPANKIETLLVRLESFLTEDSGRVVGIVGALYPSREKIEVRMDMSCDKASNDKRRDFNQYAQGFRFGKDFIKMDTGAILRLPCIRTGAGEAEAQWINLITRNTEDTQSRFRAGFASVELYTPEPLKQTRREIYKELKDTVPENRLQHEIDERMLETCLLSKQQRYHGAVKFYDNKKPILGAQATINTALEVFYAQDRFKAVTDPGTQKVYEREQPGVWIRALNASGEVLAALEVTPTDLFKGKAEEPQERADMAKGKLAQLVQEFPDAQYSMMTYSKIAVSHHSLTVTDPAAYEVKAFRRAQSMSIKEKVEDDGEKYFEARAMEAGCLFAENGMVSSFIVPTGAKNVDVAILNARGEEMPVAGEHQKEEAVPPTSESEAVPPASDDTPEPPKSRRPRNK